MGLCLSLITREQASNDLGRLGLPAGDRSDAAIIVHAGIVRRLTREVPAFLDANGSRSDMSGLNSGRRRRATMPLANGLHGIGVRFAQDAGPWGKRASEHCN
jgi:hypothetical protein